jgi:signal peptidase I
MHKKHLFIGLALVAFSAVIAGTVYAWSAPSSDVGRSVAMSIPDESSYQITGNSMSPTIQNGDWLAVDSHIGTLHRGQIVILRFPTNDSKLLCRRIVAVGGDRVVMKYYANVKITTVYTNANTSGIVYPSESQPNGNAYGEYDTIVAPGTVYVIGDNAVPGASYDSDEWGVLPDSDVVGAVVKRLSPSPTNF